jgi:CHAT domain
MDEILSSLPPSQLIELSQNLLEHIEDGPKRNKLRESLAIRLYEHYQTSNKWQSLEDATDYLGKIIEETDDDDLVNSARVTFFYSRCLRDRFMRGRNDDDLDTAINFASESVSRTQRLSNVDQSQFLQRQSHLLLCWFTKVHQLEKHEEEDSESMMNVARDVEVQLADSHGTADARSEAQSVLGLVYQELWERNRIFDDLVHALELGYEVLAAIPASDSYASARATALSNLAFRLQRAYFCFIVGAQVPPGKSLSEGEDLLNDSVRFLADSTYAGGDRRISHLENVLTFVTYASNFPRGRREQILAMCANLLRSSVIILTEIYAESSIEDQEDSLTTFYGISRYAAAAILQAEKDPYEALVFLEKGRGVAALSFHNKNQNGSEAENASSDASKSISLQLAKTLDLSKDRDVVVVNITNLRSDAIILSKGAIRYVHLSNLDEDILSEISWEIQTRLAREKDQEAVFHELRSKLTALLRYLWKFLVKPVLTELGYTTSVGSSDSWPHICWIPTGVLSLYPIHAAGLGLHTDANTMNRVISSYAPSITSMLHMRKSRNNLSVPRLPVIGQGSTSRGLNALVVSMPSTPGRQPLELSTNEAEAVRIVFPDTRTLTCETTQNVLDAAASEPDIVHFSCHGEVDYDRPLQSHLLTADWQSSPLTAERLQLLKTRKSWLAFLSACFTANAGVENRQDEHTHLAIALQLAGFPNVVASLWYVGQDAALAVIQNFYQRLCEEDRNRVHGVADALHHAVLDFCETTRNAANRMKGDPVSWAPFLHYTI